MAGMKTLTLRANKVPGLSTASLIFNVLDFQPRVRDPGTGREVAVGFSTKEIRRRARVEAALRDALEAVETVALAGGDDRRANVENVVLALEDADAECLKKCVEHVEWQTRRPEFVQLEDDVLGMFKRPD